MLRFNCICGNRFERPDADAGEEFQCTVCGRLVTVPTPAELLELDADGYIKMDDEPVITSKDDAVRELTRVYAPTHRDEYGNELDLREAFAAGSNVGDISTRTNPMSTSRPKYDPETGELVRPIDLKKQAALRAIPVEAGSPTMARVPIAPGNTLGYSGRKTRVVAGQQGGPVLLQLMAPLNVLTMCFFGVVHLMGLLASVGIYGLASAISAVLGGASIFVMFIPVASVCAVIVYAYYTTTLEAVAADGMDELPRPLGNLSWSEDMWLPAFKLGIAAIITFTPAVVFEVYATKGAGSAQLMLHVAALAALGVGLLVFPAVWMTTSLATAYSNLRPDRLIRVMLTIGPGYVWLVMVGAFALAAQYLFYGLLLINLPVFEWLDKVGFDVAKRIVGLLVMFPVSIVSGLYFAWLIGAAYEKYNRDFPWAWQGREREKFQGVK